MIMHSSSRHLVRVAVALAGMSAIAGGCGGKDSSTAPVDPTIVASVTVVPLLDTLVSIGETVQLGAVARNAAGAPVPSATISWSSNNAAVVSIAGAGSATGVSNGTATVTASADGIQGSATIVVKQRVATLEVVSGDDQGAQAATTLDTAIVLVAKDALGHVVPGAVIDFTPTAGATEPAQATTDAEGLVSTAWTMGTVAGAQELDVTVAQGTQTATLTATFTAVTFPAPPDSIQIIAGDDQSELAALPLPQAIQVMVLDRFGNRVPDLPVIFTSTDGGTLDSTDVLTNLDGIASTTWTLGGTLGEYFVSATVADSAIPAGAVVRGGPVAFTATAVPFTVALPAATVVAGDVVRLSGTGLSLMPSEQTVTVDGVPATIGEGSATSLFFTVPSFGCVPGQSRTVEVTRGSNVATLEHDVQPEGLLRLQPGERVILPADGNDCLQLPAASAGTDEYLVGLTATGRLNAQLLVELSALTAATVVDTSAKKGGIDIAPILRRTSLRGAMPTHDGSALLTASANSPAARHIAQREWESRFFSSTRSVARPSAELRLTTTRAAAVGDMLSLRVPNILGDACNDYTAVDARVLAEGPRVVIATNAAMPTGPLVDAAVLAAINGLITLFGDEIYAAIVEHFGLPADLDADGQVTLLFTPAVLSIGVPAFSSAADATDRATCPSSDEGAIIYVAMEAAPTVADVTRRLRQAAPHLAHELVHVVQSRRIALGGVPIAAWLAEGQAELGTELVGFLRAGLAERADLGAADLASVPAATWLAPRFDHLSALFGWDAAGGKIAGAPEGCSLFGFGGLSVPCRDDYVAGAGWSFMRYVLDRVANGPAGADTPLLQNLLALDLSGDGTTLFESLTGSPLEELMIEWAMTLSIDGRIAAALAPDLQFASWNLAGVFASLPAEQRLVPAAHGFSEFVNSFSVVGGGTAYTTVSASGAHGALSIRARDPAGELLGSALAPRLWVVRVR